MSPIRVLPLVGLLCLLTGCNILMEKVVELADDDEPPATQTAEVATPDVDAANAARPDEAPPRELPPGGDLQIYDKGLGVVRATITLPRGWRANQDISTDPESGETQRYLLDYYGPNGELARALGYTTYYGPMGQRFAEMWPRRVRAAVDGLVSDLKLGKRQPNDMLDRLPELKKIVGDAPVETFEVTLEGTRDGKPVAGKAMVLHMPRGKSPPMGSFVASVLLAEPDRIDAAEDALYAIGRSERVSPAFKRKIDEITRRKNAEARARMARSRRQHQQRMRNRQAAFDAHQRRMKSQSAAFDRANQTWLNNFRGGGSAGSGGYDSHDQLIDSIHERESFHDPSTGRTVQRDGQYRYNYTDGRGNFFGTDDPSFEPSALDGDWRATTPLRPE